MTRTRRTLLVAAAAAFAAPVSVRAQDAEFCGIYAAVLQQFAPDTSHKSLVVYDSVSLATPSFAFRGWVSMGPPKPESKVPLTDSLWQEIRKTYREREALPSCFAQGRSVTRARYDSLQAPFKDRDKGWEQFEKAFPAARGFFVLGRPYFINADRTQALVYIAHAGHWLSGSGSMVLLRKEQGRWQIDVVKTISSPLVRYAERTPDELLARWIACYWEFAVLDGAPSLHNVPPDGCTSLVVPLGGQLDGKLLYTGPGLNR